MDFLCTLSKVASDDTNMFLPASTSSSARPVQQFPRRWYGNRQQRGQRLAAIRARLPGDIIFETLAMGQVLCIFFCNPLNPSTPEENNYKKTDGRDNFFAGPSTPNYSLLIYYVKISTLIRLFVEGCVCVWTIACNRTPLTRAYRLPLPTSWVMLVLTFLSSFISFVLPQPQHHPADAGLQ